VKLVPVILLGLCSMLAPLAAADGGDGSPANAPAPVAIELNVHVAVLKGIVEFPGGHCGQLTDTCYGFFNAGMSGGCPKDDECVQAPFPAGTPFGDVQPWVCLGPTADSC